MCFVPLCEDRVMIQKCYCFRTFDEEIWKWHWWGLNKIFEETMEYQGIKYFNWWNIHKMKVWCKSNPILYILWVKAVFVRWAIKIFCMITLLEKKVLIGTFSEINTLSLWEFPQTYAPKYSENICPQLPLQFSSHIPE